MSAEDLLRQRENERLRAALADAIEYLRRMPHVPETILKIRDLATALEPRAEVHAGEIERAWSSERLTPDGKKLTLSMHERALHFSTEVPLPGGTRIAWSLDTEKFDALIDALIAERQPIR